MRGSLCKKAPVPINVCQRAKQPSRACGKLLVYPMARTDVSCTMKVLSHHEIQTSLNHCVGLIHGNGRIADTS